MGGNIVWKVSKTFVIRSWPVVKFFLKIKARLSFRSNHFTSGIYQVKLKSTVMGLMPFDFLYAE